MKCMLIVFFEIHGIIHYEFILKGETVPLFLFRCSATSIGRCVMKMTQEVAGTLEIDSSTMTMLPLILLCLCKNFWQNNGDCCYTPSLLLRSGILWLLPFPKTQDGSDRKKIWWHYHDSKTSADYNCQVQNMGLLQMFSTMAQSPGSLNQVARELFQRRQLGITGKCHLEKNKIQIFSDHPLYAVEVVKEAVQSLVYGTRLWMCYQSNGTSREAYRLPCWVPIHQNPPQRRWQLQVTMLSPWQPQLFVHRTSLWSRKMK